MRLKVFTYGFMPDKFLVNSLVSQLSKQHEVTVSTGLPNYSEGTFQEGYGVLGPYSEKYYGARILRYLVAPRGKSLFKLSLNYLSNLFFGTLNILRLGPGDCAFVFATSPIMIAIPAVIYCRLKKIPLVIWLQDLWPESFIAVVGKSRYPLVEKMLGAMVRWIYKNTDMILVQSPGFKENLEKYGFKGEVAWVPNWAPAETKLTNPNWLQKVPKDKFVVTFAGNIGKAQKLDTLLDAASILSDQPEIIFIIVGDGVSKERLESQSSNLDNVLFLGRRPNEDMMALFKASSALLVMLKDEPVFAQTIPSKLQSYLRASKPIIGSLNGVAAEIIEENQLGKTAPSEDPESLARVILELSKASPSELSAYGERAYQLYSDKFKEDTVISMIEEKLQRISKS